MLTFKEYRLLEESRSKQLLEEGVVDWLKKTVNDLFDVSGDGVTSAEVQAAMSRAPTAKPDAEMVKLVDEFMKQQAIKKKLAQAEYNKLTLFQKIKPILLYFVIKVKDQWNKMSERDKQRVYSDLKNFAFKALEFVLNVILSALKK